MSVSVKLALYGFTLAVIFVLAFSVAGAVVPEDVVRDWTEDVQEPGEEMGHDDDV